MYTKKLLSFCLLLFTSVCGAQVVSGYVYDEKEDLPLEGAFVYFDGTTISASTDAEGYFKITPPRDIKADLIISYIGFINFRITEPTQLGGPVKILMRENAIGLKEVVINRAKSPFSRAKMLDAFKESFFGDSKGGRSCVIENEDDIDLYFDVKDNSLNARSLRPLKIQNKYLEYEMLYDLEEFRAQFNRETLSQRGMRGLYFGGPVFFTDVSRHNSAYSKRKETYLGSTRHFMKTLVENDWDNQSFVFFVNSQSTHPRAYFRLKDTLGLTKVTFIARAEQYSPLNISRKGETLEELQKRQREYQEKIGTYFCGILYDDRDYSEFSFRTGEFYVTPTGQYYPIGELRFKGMMARQKAGDMLPSDYRYP